jgi:hypothetical protein
MARWEAGSPGSYPEVWAERAWQGQDSGTGALFLTDLRMPEGRL